MAKAPNNPFEKIADPAGEARDIKETAALTEKLLDKRYTEKKKPVLRGVHPKSHGCLRASFEVRHDLAPELRVGLFAKPGKRYDAWVRFSNAAIKVEHDLGDKDPKKQQNGSRGMAVKVLDVDGRVLLDDNGGRSQDFLMINTSAFAFVDAKQYLSLNQALDQFNDDETQALAATVLRHLAPDSPSPPAEKARALKSATVVQEIVKRKVANPTEVSYFGAAPFLFGPDRVMRFKAEPWGGDTEDQAIPKNPPGNYLRQAVRRTVNRREDVCFDFMVQVRGKNEKNLKIEDATADWPDTPFVAVARIIIPAPQERPGADRREAWARREARCEKLAFTPWHCLAAHQPLGSINRLRKAVYIASADKRAASKPKPRRPTRPAKKAVKRASRRTSKAT